MVRGERTGSGEIVRGKDTRLAPGYQTANTKVRQGPLLSLKPDSNRHPSRVGCTEAWARAPFITAHNFRRKWIISILGPRHAQPGERLSHCSARVCGIVQQRRRQLTEPPVWPHRREGQHRPSQAAGATGDPGVRAVGAVQVEGQYTRLRRSVLQRRFLF